MARANPRLFYYGLLGLAVFLVIGAVAYNASNSGRMRESVHWVTKTERIKTEINQLVSEHLATETYGLRYLLSGREDFLKRYVESTFLLDEQLEKISELLADNPEQMQRVTDLRAAVESRNEAVRKTIAATQQIGVAAAVREIRWGESVTLGESIRGKAKQIEDAESDLLHQRQARLDASIVQNNTTVLLVNALALLAGAIGLLAIRHSNVAVQERRIAEINAEQARRASQEKSAFLASMSHEIRTPMNAVFGFTQLLAKTQIEPRAQEYIKAIQTSGAALLALINDILDLSKVEAGKLRLAPVATDLRELIDSTLVVFVEPAASKQLALRSTVAPDVPRTLVLDPHRLRQILTNLISNAVKYTESGQVEVNVSAAEIDAERGCELLIAVRDSGIGIGEEQLQHLFEPFYRAVGDEQRDIEGTGLGLAIVLRLLGLMQGEIQVDSELGKGSEFSVRLHAVPIAGSAAAAESAAVEDVDFSQLTPSRILIVDDVAWNRELLAAFLGKERHQLAFAADGAEALKLAVELDPDLVLMDLRMPVMDGREAVQRIREAKGQSRPKVVAVSASSMADEERQLAPHFDGFVRKPVARSVLFQTLVELIGTEASSPPTVASDEQEPDQSVELQAVDDAQRDEVLLRLHEIVEQELPSICASMRTREVRALAEELLALGEQGRLQGIRYFGQRLLAALERFDLVTMESLLNQLPVHLQHADSVSGGPQ